MKNNIIIVRLFLYLIYFTVGTYVGTKCKSLYELFIIISLIVIMYFVSHTYYSKKKR